MIAKAHSAIKKRNNTLIFLLTGAVLERLKQTSEQLGNKEGRLQINETRGGA